MDYEKGMEILKESLIDAYVSNKTVKLTINSIHAGILIDLQGILLHFEEKRDGDLLLVFDENNFIHLTPNEAIGIAHYKEKELELNENEELFIVSQKEFTIDIYISSREGNVEDE